MTRMTRNRGPSRPGGCFPPRPVGGEGVPESVVVGFCYYAPEVEDGSLVCGLPAVRWASSQIGP
jgi:hypothetical protein